MESALRDQAPRDLTVIETFRFEAGAYPRLERHLARCAATCARLGVAFERGQAEAALEAARKPARARIRLTVDLAGRIAVAAAPFEPTPPDAIWPVALAEERLDAADPWLQVKTSRRALYDAARAALPPGIEEMLFANQAGALCEGAVTNVFLDLGDDLVTPPLRAGLLPGVLRAELLETGACRETPVFLSDLQRARRLFVGNSLRGLIPARLTPL